MNIGDITGIGQVSDLIGTIIQKVDPDKTPIELATLQANLTLEMAKEGLIGQQIQVNAEEAKNGSWWVAGARPLFLWSGGLAFAYRYIIQPFLSLCHGAPLPELPLDSVYTEVTLGLLGLDTGNMAFKHAVNNGVVGGKNS